MKITVFGTGYVGLIAGLGFSKWGNQVMCFDIVEEKIARLRRGECPIYEPGANTQLWDGLESGRLQFTSSAKEAVTFGEVIFIAVGTPEGPDGSVDLQYVYAAADQIATYTDCDKLVVDKSTVPVGTACKVKTRIQNQLIEMGKGDIHVEVASNPEFMREGKAVQDFNNPDRIILGVTSEHAEKTLISLYSTFARSNKPVVVTTPETAELIKYATNAFLATKITFVNEMANLCEKVGADAQIVAAAMGKDGRISSKFLHAGPGYGGSCFPKDTKALSKIGEVYGARQTVVESVIRANERQKLQAAEKVMERFPTGAHLAVLGLSFKPDTDDVRESPAIHIVKTLLRAGNFTMQVYDPKAMENTKQVLGGRRSGIIWCNSAMEAIDSVDAILIPTEWGEFSALDLHMVGQKVRQKVLFDFRNIFKKKQLEQAGFEYHGTGIG